MPVSELIMYCTDLILGKDILTGRNKQSYFIYLKLNQKKEIND